MFSVQAVKSKRLREENENSFETAHGAVELRQDRQLSQKLNFPNSLERWEYYVSAPFLLESLLSTTLPALLE
jgi:hypothetical protein